MCRSNTSGKPILTICPMRRATSSTRSVMITKSLVPRISWACCASCTLMAPSSPKWQVLWREHSSCPSGAQKTVEPKLRPLGNSAFGLFVQRMGSASYRNFHFLCLICKQLSPLLRRSGQRGGAVVQPRHRHNPIPPHSVDADAYSTLPGLECLSADLCRSLGGVSARPSALSDPLLRRSGGEDARVWQSGKDR